VVFRFEEFEFDEVTFRLSRAGEAMTPEPKVLHLLSYLLENRGRLVRKQELLDHVWPESNVSESAVTRAFVLLRKTLGDDSHLPRFIETVPTLGYRFISKVVVVDAPPSTDPPNHVTFPKPSTTTAPGSTFRRRWVLASLLAIAVVGAMGVFYLSHRTRPLTERDTIVLADFANTTGDPVFDETLRQGLEVQLGQSPFLALIPDDRIHYALALMGQPAGTRLTPSVAREVCERTASVAVLDGSIAALGSQYVLGLRATDCRNGEIIAEEQAQVARKEEVLTALDGIASKLRVRLGESLATVEKFDTPLAEATTPSLEALKAFSLGKKESAAGRVNAGLQFYQRAVELDPNFAAAYESMVPVGAGYLEEGQAAENIRKAYALRNKVSEKERLSIEATYYAGVTGELEKAISAYELLKQTYPRDDIPYRALEVLYRRLGQHEKALEEGREALRRAPDRAVNYQNVAGDLVSLGRLDEAEAVFKQGEDRNLVFQGHARSLYLLAFLKDDTAKMAQLAASAIGKPGTEEGMLSAESDTEAWYGRLHAARNLTQRAIDLAERKGARETAAAYMAQQSMLEADVGQREQALTDARMAVKVASNRDVQAMASLALVRAGDVPAGEKLAEELNRNFPIDTLAQRYWLPAIRAAAALERHDAAGAETLLETGRDMEFANPPVLTTGLPQVYLHGYAYLALHDRGGAAVEFQKYIDHRGQVRNSPWGALARLGLARAYAVQGDSAKARAAYQAFLTLWKDADPDISLLKQAQREYAALSPTTPATLPANASSKGRK
jgi:DNA-binding winged helix-turn-helix (wHTH) protein/tetratricopeptide (TPR) repeat protein